MRGNSGHALTSPSSGFLTTGGYQYWWIAKKRPWPWPSVESRAPGRTAWKTWQKPSLRMSSGSLGMTSAVTVARQVFVSTWSRLVKHPSLPSEYKWASYLKAFSSHGHRRTANTYSQPEWPHLWLLLRTCFLCLESSLLLSLWSPAKMLPFLVRASSVAPRTVRREHWTWSPSSWFWIGHQPATAWVTSC